MRKLAAALIAALFVLVAAPGSLLFAARIAFAQAPASPDETKTIAKSGGDAAVSQEDAADFGEAAVPITQIRGVKDKTLIFVFDVSGSMRDGGNLRRARAATVNILREGAVPGDHLVLLTFGAGYKKVFDTKLESRADLSSLIQKVPSSTEEGAGTNIRKPHHEALKIVDTDDPHPAFIVLLTDSFNDEPKSGDIEYPNYLKYYTPGGMLTKYPRTPENADYERLLKKLLASGRLSQYGIGIKIAANGRPIERLPQAAPPPVEAPDNSDAVRTPIAAPPASSTDPRLFLWIGLGIAAVIAAVVIIRPLTATTALRITGGPSGKKDFSLRNGQSLRLGGDGAAVAFDAYAIPGAKEPLAHIHGSRGQLSVAPHVPATAPKTPVASVPAAGGSNQEARSRVFHNGLPLEKEVPLRYGDEMRLSVASESGEFKDYRLRFEDPRKSY